MAVVAQNSPFGGGGISVEWKPYGSFSDTSRVYTQMYTLSERISQVDIYKGSNGCITGVTLKSPSGTESKEWNTWITTTQAPKAQDCTQNNALCRTKSLLPG